MAKQRAYNKDTLFQKILPALEENPFSESGPAESQDDAADELSALRNRLFARTDGLEPPAAVATINVMETLVLQQLDEAIRKFNVCSCDRCRADVAACALNLLPPKYIVTRPDRTRQVLEQIPQKMISDALIKAVIQVRSHPRH